MDGNTENDSKFAIQNSTMGKLEDVPGHQHEEAIPDAHWLDLTPEAVAAKSNYLKMTCTGDPKDVRTKFRYEDYLDSGADPEIYKLVLENIDMIPNLGKTRDTMEHYWLKETILRNWEKRGLSETYYDKEGNEVASFRGKHGPWSVASWAKKDLIIKKQSDSNLEEPTLDKDNEMESVIVKNEAEMKDSLIQNVERQKNNTNLQESTLNKGNDSASFTGKKTLATWAKEYFTQNMQRKKNISQPEKSTVIIENNREVASSESPETKPELQNNAEDISNMISLSEEKNKFDTLNDCRDIETISQDTETNLDYENIRNTEIDSIAMSPIDYNSNEGELNYVQHEKNETNRIPTEKIDFSRAHTRKQYRGTKLSSHYGTLNRFSIGYLSELNNLKELGYLNFKGDCEIRNMSTLEANLSSSKNTDFSAEAGTPKEDLKDQISTSEAREYIANIWESLRLDYEFLREKNPFANVPPEPQFLVDTYSDKHRKKKRSGIHRSEYENLFEGKDKNKEYEQKMQNEFFPNNSNHIPRMSNNDSGFYPDKTHEAVIPQYNYYEQPHKENILQQNNNNYDKKHQQDFPPYYPYVPPQKENMLLQKPPNPPQTNKKKNKTKEEKVYEYLSEPVNSFPKIHPSGDYIGRQRPSSIPDRYSIIQYGRRKEQASESPTRTQYTDSKSPVEDFSRDRRHEEYMNYPYESRRREMAHNGAIPDIPAMNPRNYQYMPYGQYRTISDLKSPRYNQPQNEYHGNNPYEAVPPYSRNVDVYGNVSMPSNPKLGKTIINPYLRDIQNGPVDAQFYNSQPNQNIPENVNYYIQPPIYPRPPYYDPGYASYYNNPFNPVGYWQEGRYPRQYSPNFEFNREFPPMGSVPAQLQQLDRLRQEQEMKYMQNSLRNWYVRPYANRNEEPKDNFSQPPPNTPIVPPENTEGPS